MRRSVNMKEGRTGSLLFLRRDKAAAKATKERAESFPLLHALYGSDADAKARRAAPAEPSPLRDELHLLCTSPERLRERVLMGELKTTNLRSLRWRVLLGSLSVDWRSWAVDVQTQRDQYTRWRGQYVIDPRGASSGGGGSPSAALSPLSSLSPSPPLASSSASSCRDDVLLPRGVVPVGSDDPLSQNEASQWNQFFKTTQLHREIHEDVIRTYPDNEFFTRREVVEIMERVLFVYAMLNPQLRYVQGMNEVLAPLLYVVHGDYHRVHSLLDSPLGSGAGGLHADAAGPDGSDETLRVLRETAKLEFIEHDAYWLFSQLMSIIGDWFISPKAQEITPENAIRQAPRQSYDHVKVVSKCQQIQTLLSVKDPELASCLTEMDIQPQLYMLRWVRILFSQVFALEDLVLLWDAIFAAGPPFAMVDAICVTMLMLVRTGIIGEDYSNVLDLLFHYPRTHSPSLITSVALNVLISPNTPFFIATSVPQRFTSPGPLASPSMGTLQAPPMSPDMKRERDVPPPSPRSAQPSAPSQPMVMQELSVLSSKKTAAPKPDERTSAPTPAAVTSKASRSKTATATEMSWAPAKPLASRPTAQLGSGTRRGAFALEDSPSEVETLHEKLSAAKAMQQHISNRLERVIYTLGTVSGATTHDQQSLQVVLSEMQSIKQALAGDEDKQLKRIAALVSREEDSP
eukprot:m51a1_g1334 hypothetical protein (688) ;mRNA; f:300393-303199